jgi:hypothetical protein
MENPQKPTRNHEQEPKTLEDYVVATFHVDVDPDDARRPLTVIRSGQDGEGVEYDRGWNPIGMSVVCDTDSEEGIGPIKLLMEAYKLIGTDIKTEFVSLEDIQGLNEDYIKYLYGKTPKEMIEEAKQIWRQKHPDSMRIESLAPGVGSDSGAETPSNSLVEDNTSDHEKSLADEVSPAMGNLAVKTVEVSPVKTNEVGANSSALVMTKEIMESIGAIKVNDSVDFPAVRAIGIKKPVEIDKVGINPADLVATEPVKKLVEADKASADLVDLPAAKSVENPVVEKSMETNEANVDILPEGFKDAINEFKRLTKDNNNQFADVARNLMGSLSEFRESITRTPTAIKDPRITEFTTNALLRISEFEASRVEILNSFIDEGFSKEMFVDSKKDPAKSTGILVKKLAGLGEILRGVYVGHSGRDSLVQAIDKIIVDLSTVSRDRWNILDAVNKIKSVWGDDKS